MSLAPGVDRTATRRIPDLRSRSDYGEFFVDHPDRLSGKWDKALSSDVPGNDRDVPPHINLGQAKAFGSVLTKRGPEEGRVTIETATDVLSSVLPGRRSRSITAGGPDGD